jgi:hypothetical protein
MQRRFKSEENVNMHSLVVDSNFRYVQIENDFAKGLLIPKFDSWLSGGLDQFTFAIDFGTTNTHIEYSKNGNIAKPLEFTSAESYHIGHLIDDSKHDEAFLKLCKVDLLPNNIIKDGNFSFPQRTVSAYHKQVNFAQPVFSMANITIPFKYEKSSFAVNTEIKTNLKWNHDDSSGPVMRSFFEQVIKMIRNKVLLNNGDLKKTKIVWSYPASMMMHHLNKLEDQWADIITKYLGEEIDVVKACESLTPFYYLYEEKGVPALAKPVVSIDIGGGTSDIAVFKQTKPILFSSYKFAGDAIFGDNYNRNININGFVKKYNKVLSDRLKENNLGDLIGVLSNIISRNNSNDAVNALFSVENNNQLKEIKLNVSFLDELKDDTELKIIFLIFYVAQIYHVAQILKAKDIEIPSAFSFSGTASKLLTIIDGSSKNNLKAIAKEVFQYVFETQEDFKIDILLEDNPKEIAAKGAIYYEKYDEVNLRAIKEVLINSVNLSSNKELTYEDIDSLEEKALADYNEFLEFFFDLNKTIPFRDFFGIEKDTLKYTKEFLNEKSLNALKMGIQNKKQELDNHTDEPIVETLFFYPLVGSLGELAYNLVSK